MNKDSQNYLLPITLLGVGGLIWFCVGMGYTFGYMGTQANTNSFSAFSNQMLMQLGTAIIGSFAMAIGLVLLTIQWASVESTAYLAICIATVAFACSVSSLCIAAVTH
jgi:hypothetical protein